MTGRAAHVGLCLTFLSSHRSPHRFCSPRCPTFPPFAPRSILFFVTIFTAMGSMFGALQTFSTERGIVNRERASKAYHVLPY